MSHIKTNPSIYDCVVIYDRGDGLISLIPVESVFHLNERKNSLYDFLLCNFTTFDYKKESISTLKFYMDKVVKERNAFPSKLTASRRKHLTNKELQFLNMYMSGMSINDIAMNLNHLGVKTIYTRKYKIMEKLGVASTRQIFKLQSNWKALFD